MTQRGSLILTEGRSGTNWLGSISNQTKQLGTTKEWLSAKNSGDVLGSIPYDAFCDHVVKLASTPNGYFCFKIFPRHLFDVQNIYGEDIVAGLQRKFSVQFVLLKRRDRIGQAVSLAMAHQTGQWKSTAQKSGKAAYDFELICRCYFHIDRSYAFWDSYIAARSLDVVEHCYEDLLDDTKPFVETLSTHAEVENMPIMRSEVEVQRGETSNEWRTRFEADLASENILDPSLARAPAVTGSNLVKFLRGQRQKPDPFVL